MNKVLSTLLLCLALLSAAPAEVYVNDNGTLREISEIYVNDNGTLREIEEGYVNDNGTLRQFFLSEVTASASPSSVSGTSGVPGTITTNSTTCTGNPAGGTFEWDYVSGDSSIVATASGLATTTFQATVTENGSIEAVYRCQYTLGGDVVFSNNVTATLTLF